MSFHGSDIEKIEEIYGIPKENIICYSGNVNPLGLPYSLLEKADMVVHAMESYPDREYNELKKCLAEYVGTVKENILPGNGSTELIIDTVEFISPKTALMVAPTYSEYESELKKRGCNIRYFILREEENFKLNLEELKGELSNNYDLLLLCNPNNPTSSAVSKDEIMEILLECRKYNTMCMIDETYVEFSPVGEDISAASLTESFDNLIVLRSISKFFSAPGLRLGYAICGNRDLNNLIMGRKMPWFLHNIAVFAGCEIVRDKNFINDTIHFIDKERKRVVEKLKSSEYLKVYEPHANFIFVRLINTDMTSEELFERAIMKGLMIRDCSDFRGLDKSYFRFCLLTEEKNNMLTDFILDTVK